MNEQLYRQTFKKISVWYYRVFKIGLIYIFQYFLFNKNKSYTL